MRQVLQFRQVTGAAYQERAHEDHFNKRKGKEGHHTQQAALSRRKRRVGSEARLSLGQELRTLRVWSLRQHVGLGTLVENESSKLQEVRDRDSTKFDVDE
jgi:hypothetical protein